MIGLLGLLLAAAPGCSSTQPAGAAAAGEVLTVEGRVEVRGSEPLTAYVLDTDGGSSYVLELSEDQRSDLQTPIRIRATGTLYRGEWGGMPYAHLRVQSWERISGRDADEAP